MYEENGTGFDPTSLHEDGYSQTHLQNCTNNNNTHSFSSMDDQNQNSNNYPSNQQDNAAVAAALEMELQHQINLEMEHCYNNNNGNHDIHQEIHDQIAHDSSTWQEMSTNFNGENTGSHFAADHVQNGHFTTTPDLLTMFPLPRCSSSSLLQQNPFSSKSPSFLASLGLLGDLNPTVVDRSSASGSVVYDPLLPLNLPPQPPLLRELFHSLPHGGYNSTLGGGTRINGSLFGGVDENVGCYQNDNGVFEFTAGEMDFNGKNRDGKDTKHFATERHRRVLLNDKYQALRQLVPNPTKNDRASIVGDAIDYINELKRTVTELKVLVDKKRCIRERLKRPKNEDDNGNESKSLCDNNPYNGSSLRSSWLHRKSKNTEVDVRIIDDEVTVKLVQQKRINCLLFVSKVLDDLQLDLHHVAGGLIGDYYSFLFNSKICEGSIVYASAIANKLIEVVDKQYSAILPTSSY